MSGERTQELGEEDFAGGEEEEEEFGAENEELGEEGESFPVENDKETVTVSVSSSNKRIKEMSIDRLSALPDALIIHILSFLETKEAAITSVLSKRWRFLWTDSPWLDFRDTSWETEKTRNFVAWVHRTLVSCRGNALEGFLVDFRYKKCFASDVNACVEFAVKNKAKEVTLLLNTCGDDKFYVLPRMMLSNSSLTWLVMRGCTVAPRRSIKWQSLTKLFLEQMELRQRVIRKILSGCPVLRTLLLRECSGFHCLEINSPSLHELAVDDCECGEDEPLVEISAPYIRSLDIWQFPIYRELRLKNISSLVKASICFTGVEWEADDEEVMRNAKFFYEKLKHVKELFLGCGYLQALSMLVVNGWQLPQSRLGCLLLNACREELSITGIVGLLESSPDLETLDIEGFDANEASDTWGSPAKGDLNCDLLHLKTVKIKNFADPKFGGEPMLTLAQILLKRATVLEKMVIDVEKTTFSSSNASSDFTKIAQTLLSYPRSSQKAVVLLR